MLGGDNRSAAGGGEGNPGGSDGRKYLPPKIGKQRLIARFYYNIHTSRSRAVWSAR